MNDMFDAHKYVEAWSEQLKGNKKMEQNKIGGGSFKLGERCHRCHKPLKVKESIERGYGPICWGKLGGGVDPQTRTEGLGEHDHYALPSTITDQKQAFDSLNSYREMVMGIIAHRRSQDCSCGEPLERGMIFSYDHDGGWTLNGFKHKQWVYLHCFACGNDAAIWKLGVARE